MANKGYFLVKFLIIALLLSMPSCDLFTGPTIIPGGDGDPVIEFTYVPPYGSSDNLEGQVWHVNPTDYKVVVYISIKWTWWIKPYDTRPFTFISRDGRWICDITTGGVDIFAKRIVAFLVPKDYESPSIHRTLGKLDWRDSDVFKHSVAHVEVARSR